MTEDQEPITTEPVDEAPVGEVEETLPAITEEVIAEDSEIPAAVEGEETVVAEEV